VSPTGEPPYFPSPQRQVPIIANYPNTITWFVGPIANNPLVAARLGNAGITSAAWSYGVGNGGSCGFWRNNSLLDFSQSGTR